MIRICTTLGTKVTFLNLIRDIYKKKKKTKQEKKMNLQNKKKKNKKKKKKKKKPILNIVLKGEALKIFHFS